MSRLLGFLFTSSLMITFLSGCSTPSAGIAIRWDTPADDEMTLVADPQMGDVHQVYTVRSYIKRFDKQFELLTVDTLDLDGLIQAQVVLQNKTYKDLAIEYRFTWIDQDGMVIKTPLTTWVPVNASAKEKIYIKTVAPLQHAVDFECAIRYRNQSPRWKFRPQKEKEQV